MGPPGAQVVSGGGLVRDRCVVQPPEVVGHRVEHVTRYKRGRRQTTFKHAF